MVVVVGLCRQWDPWAKSLVMGLGAKPALEAESKLNTKRAILRIGYDYFTFWCF